MKTKDLIDIHIPFPAAGSPGLRLELASCQLRLRPGEGEAWVAGTYDELGGGLPLSIEHSGYSLRLTQLETLAESVRLESRLAPLDLTLGKGQPYGLDIDASLLHGRLDLSGLPLTHLNLKLAKGKQEVLFATPNPQPMEVLSIFVGAAQLDVRGLANANFTELKVEGGEADCLFDFSGELRRPAQGRITIPQGSLKIHVPPTIPACITVQTLTGVADVSNGFTKKAGAYWNQAALSGRSPLLTLRASVLVGTVRVQSGSPG